MRHVPAKHAIKPVKSLGQNFLTDGTIARKIVELLEIEELDTIVEIGPGEGALTKLLLEYPAEIQAIEFDRRAVEFLNSTYPKVQYPKFSLFSGDVRKFPLLEFSQEVIDRTKHRPKVIGNIPYNITSDILFQLFECAEKLNRAVITMQREVAERIVAKPRTKDYGILTLASLFASKPKIALLIPPESFYPKPKVDSAAVVFDFTEPMISTEQFYKVMPLVRSGFGQRRKMLSNSIKSMISQKNDIQQDIIDGYFSKRAEELTPNDFLKLNSALGR
ncbi:MAG: ribosomal RNA small subunit methyltransferase A [Ignavibacteria bacterium]|nr:ribosomal RNA small subunit methyltransferase A [Ignavibacteria bacterium]